MRVRAIVSVLLLVASACAGSELPPPGDEAAWVRWLDRQVPALMEEHGVRGAVIGFTEPGGSGRFLAYGVGDRRGTRVTESTTFRAASIAKTATAIGILQLVNQGILDLDGPLSLEGWEAPPGVSVRDLLRHTAGLGVPTVRRFEGAQPPSIEEALLQVKPVGPVGEVRYSGGGYEVLQLVIEETTGRPFDRWMEEQVFTPLDMRSSSMSALPQAEGFDGRDEPVPGYRYAGRAAAGLVTNGRDLLRMVEAVRADERMHRPETTPTGGESWGLGTFVDERSGTRVIGHTGQDLGWSAKWLAVPSEGAGFVVLTNGHEGARLTVEIGCAWTGWVLGMPAQNACP